MPCTILPILGDSCIAGEIAPRVTSSYGPCGDSCPLRFVSVKRISYFFASIPGLSNPDRSSPELPRGLEGDNAARAYVSTSRPARVPAGTRQGLGAGTACAACPPGAARPAHAAGFYDTKDPESRV